MNEDVQLAVKRGAYWLDANVPGWEQMIRSATLCCSFVNIGGSDCCVLGKIGQSIGVRGYYRVAQHYGLTREQEIEFGFYTLGNSSALSDEWERSLTERGYPR